MFTTLGAFIESTPESFHAALRLSITVTIPPSDSGPWGPTDGRYLSLAVKAQDLEADAGGSARLNLVQVAEEVEPSPAPPIVQLSLGQDSKQSRLP